MAKENQFIEKLIGFSHSSMNNFSTVIHGVLEHGFNKFDDFQSSYIKFFNDHQLSGDANSEVQDLIAKYKNKIQNIKSIFIKLIPKKRTMMELNTLSMMLFIVASYLKETCFSFHRLLRNNFLKRIQRLILLLLQMVLLSSLKL